MPILSNQDQDLDRIYAGENPSNFIPAIKKPTDPRDVAGRTACKASEDARHDAALEEVAREFYRSKAVSLQPQDDTTSSDAAAEMEAQVNLEAAEFVAWNRNIINVIDELNAPGCEPLDAVALESITAVTSDAATETVVDEQSEFASAKEIDAPGLAVAETVAETVAEALPVAAPAPAEEKVLPCATPGYAFPITSSVSTDPQELRTGLALLSQAYKKNKDYDAVRGRFCAISLALNEQGLWAPRFRPQPLVSPIDKKKPQSTLLHRDQLIIDAHWLWCMKSVSVFKGMYEQLLDPVMPFDFALAAAYAQENWLSHYRAEEQFMLPDEIQWQLLTTKSKEHVEAHRILIDGSRTDTIRTPARIKAIQKAIAGWAKISPKIRGEEQYYADLWVAREMLGTKAAAKHFAELAGLMSGCVPLEASTVRKKLKLLDKRL